jgi:hypothetical protein
VKAKSAKTKKPKKEQHNQGTILSTLSSKIIGEFHGRVGHGADWEPDSSMYGNQDSGDYDGPDKEDGYVHPPNADFSDEDYGSMMVVPRHVSKRISAQFWAAACIIFIPVSLVAI